MVKHRDPSFLMPNVLVKFKWGHRRRQTYSFYQWWLWSCMCSVKWRHCQWPWV